MKNTMLLLSIAALLPMGALAVDGTVLINQATVASTGGFPYKITQPGSYKLSGNLVVPLGLNGIEISADGVTLDLNGFSILGPGVFPNSGIGIYSTDRQRIQIMNGAVGGFPQGMQFLGKARSIVLEKLMLNAITQSIASGLPVSGIAAIVGQDVKAASIIRDVIAIGQIQITCPSLVRDTVAQLAETNVPYDGGGVSFGTNCKGDNVVTAPLN